MPQTSNVPQPGRLLSAAAESGQNWSGRGDLSQNQGRLVSWVAGLRLIGTEMVSTPLGGCRSRAWRGCTSYASAAGYVENAKVSVPRTSPYSFTSRQGVPGAGD